MVHITDLAGLIHNPRLYHDFGVRCHDRTSTLQHMEVPYRSKKVQDPHYFSILWPHSAFDYI